MEFRETFYSGKGLNRVIFWVIIVFIILSYSYEYLWGPKDWIYRKKAMEILKKWCYATEYYYFREGRYPSKKENLKKYFASRWDDFNLPKGWKLKYQIDANGYQYIIEIDGRMYKLGGRASGRE